MWLFAWILCRLGLIGELKETCLYNLRSRFSALRYRPVQLLQQMMGSSSRRVCRLIRTSTPCTFGLHCLPKGRKKSGHILSYEHEVCIAAHESVRLVCLCVICILSSRLQQGMLDGLARYCGRSNQQPSTGTKPTAALWPLVQSNIRKSGGVMSC